MNLNDTNRTTDEQSQDDPLEALRASTSFVAPTVIPAFATPIQVIDLSAAATNADFLTSLLMQEAMDPDETNADPEAVLSNAALAALDEAENAVVELPSNVIDDLDEATMAEYNAATARTVPRAETWDDVIGNERAIQQIQELILSARARENPVDHVLLFGPAGTGKTTISKILAREMGSYYVESTASTLTTHELVMRILHNLNVGRAATKRPSVWFIDEIHVLGKRGVPQEAFLPLFEGWAFDHNREGKRVPQAMQQHGDDVWKSSKFLTWPFTAIGATTDPGLLSAPLTRRFNVQIELDPYRVTDIAEIVRRGAARLDIQISETAAMTLADCSRLNPGRSFNILAYARTRMDALGAPEIDDAIMAETIERMGIFSQGLTNTDIRALEALASRYPKGMGQMEISKTLGIQLSQFSSMLEPYMRQLGFLVTLNRRVITPAGIRYLGRIGRAPMDNPAVRALVA